MAILLGILLKRLLPNCALGAGPYHSAVLAPGVHIGLFCSTSMVALLAVAAVAAVVVMSHDKWGETPCAFVELAEGQSADFETLRDWCRQHLAGYKMPGQFVFTAVPRTSTGKIQKFARR